MTKDDAIKAIEGEFEMLFALGVVRMWKTYRGDYCVSINQREYFGTTITKALRSALDALPPEKA